MRSLESNHVLRQYPPDCQPSHIESLGAAGGMSGAQFWRITVARESPVVRGSPDPAPRMLCLRRWPAEHPSTERLKFIHAFLQHAARNGITFVPVPITAKAGQSFVNDITGRLWQLEPWMPGTADYERAPRVEKLRAAMMALAQLHVATREFEPNAATTGGGERAASISTKQSAVAHRLAQLRELSTQGKSVLSCAINKDIWPELAPVASEFIARLSRAVPPAIAMLESLADARLTLQPCLRDVWHDHILFTGDEVTGIIDFGAVGIDTPATDIARLLGSVVADDAHGWETGLEAYRAVRSLSAQEGLAILALDRSGTILAGCNWIRWVYIERRRFENQLQVMDRFRSILVRLMQIK
jgi:Ser/Thr protein kinase RdoA (MazF antagonist)